MIESEVLEFIQTSVRSVWDLELLLCLWRSPERAWTADDLVRELRASALIVSEGLRSLQAAGLISAAEDGTYRYAPASQGADTLLRELDRLYRDRPNLIRNAVLSVPANKLQAFADAFRLKKD